MLDIKMIPSHLKLATLGFQFNLSRANRLIELARSQDEDLRSEILRGTIIVLASAIDTLFRTVIVRYHNCRRHPAFMVPKENFVSFFSLVSQGLIFELAGFCGWRAFYDRPIFLRVFWVFLFLVFLWTHPIKYRV
jgi:hypothetical protein